MTGFPTIRPFTLTRTKIAGSFFGLGKGPEEKGCHLLAVDGGVRAEGTRRATFGDARQGHGIYVRLVKGPGVVAEVVGR